MDYNITERQEMLKRVARDFFTRELPKSLVEDLADHPKGYTEELWEKMAGLEWMGLLIPEEYRGLGGSYVDLIILLEEAGRACLPGTFFSAAVLGAITIMEAGNDTQKRRLLPEIASGDMIVSLAVSEPDAIYSPAHFKVKAKLERDEYVINGTKLFVPDAHIADYIVCAARTDRGITLFLVDNESKGLECTLLPTLSGDKQCEVNFSGVRVKRDDILGDIDRGGEYLEKILPKAAVAMCAQMLGGAQRVLEMTVEYAKSRVQFGKAIGSQQAVQHHCANMLMDVEGMRYSTYKAAWLLDEGLPCKKEVSVAKAWANEAFYRITALGHQCHGAIAFQRDHSMYLYSQRASSWLLYFGDTNYHEKIIAGEIGLL
jgi:alkylation response protein AidB-like acyl-CoA dehydrogenase